MMSRPAAFNSVASAVIAIVGDGLTRARRSARKDMTGLGMRGEQLEKLHANPSGVKPVPARGVTHFEIWAASQNSAVMEQSHRIWQSNGSAAHVARFVEPPGGAGSIAGLPLRKQVAL